MVAIIRKSVVLPAPSDPTNPYIFPSGKVKETPATASSRPNFLDTSFTWMKGKDRRGPEEEKWG